MSTVAHLMETTERDAFFDEFDVRNGYMDDWEAIRKCLDADTGLNIDDLTRGPATTLLFAIVQKVDAGQDGTQASTQVRVFAKQISCLENLILSDRDIHAFKHAVFDNTLDPNIDEDESGPDDVEVATRFITKLAAYHCTGIDESTNLNHMTISGGWLYKFFSPYKLVVFLIDNQYDEYLLYGVVPYANKSSLN